MFIISCKYNKTSNYVINLCQQIRNFHSNELIMVVDSDSDDKSYFDELKKYNVIIDDAKNKNWMIGAYWRGYKKFPNEHYYFCFHDSMKVKANLDYLKEKPLNLIATFDRIPDSAFVAWNYRIEHDTTYDYSMVKKTKGRGCYGPIFMCNNDIMTSMFNHGVHKILPNNKSETGCLEGLYGLIFELEGFDLDDCSMYGDILELESPNGKSGGRPHNTTWQFPIEKFYASLIDNMRRN